jgi:hypothetical protein
LSLLHDLGWKVGVKTGGEGSLMRPSPEIEWGGWHGGSVKRKKENVNCRKGKIVKIVKALNHQPFQESVCVELVRLTL